MDRILTGVGDGCDSCLAPRVLWTNEESISEGFPLNRTFESNAQTWASLPRNSRGDLVKTTGDFATRQGLCNPPITLRETFSFSVTHKVSYIFLYIVRGKGSSTTFTCESYVLNLFFKCNS